MRTCTKFRPPKATGNSPSTLRADADARPQQDHRARRAARVLIIAILVAIGEAFINAPLTSRASINSTPTAYVRSAVLWHDPGNPASLDLIGGAGGKAHAPASTDSFTFLKEDLDGTNPKFDVKDSRGVHWRVKLGQEAQAETAATRLMWAAGYFVDEDYYLPQIQVDGLPRLHRGRQFVSEGGIVRHVRLERKIKNVKKIGNWDWFDNPFTGTRELNGLRVLMSLINNWDLQTINNSIYLVDGTPRYLVSDPGASLGKTGNNFHRSKSDVWGYQKSKFIHRETTTDVDFTMHSRPFFLTALNIPNYKKRMRIEKVTKHIPRSDARWLGEILGRLSDEQIRDCFRAAGYTPAQVAGYSQEVLKRISELEAL